MKKCLILVTLFSINSFYASDKPHSLRETRAKKLAQVNQRRARHALSTQKSHNFDEAAFNVAYEQLMQARTIRAIITPADLGITETEDTKFKDDQKKVYDKQNQKKRRYKPTINDTRA